MKSHIKKIKDNTFIQVLLITGNIIFLLSIILPLISDRFMIIDIYIGEHLPWIYMFLFVIFVLSLILGNAKKYKFILVPMRVVTLIAIFPALYVSLMYLIAAIFNVDSP